MPFLEKSGEIHWNFNLK